MLCAVLASCSMCDGGLGWGSRVPEECPEEVALLIQRCVALNHLARPRADELCKQLRMLIRNMDSAK